MVGKKARIVYLYTMTFILLAMLVTGIIFTVNMILNVALPDKYTSYSTYDTSYDTSSEKENISEQNRANQRIRDLVGGIVFVGVVAPLYGYHFSKIQKERKIEA